MARQKEIMAEIDFYGSPIKNVLVKIPTHCTKDQTDIENLEFSIMDLVLMDRDLTVILKDIFNLGIILQTFTTTEKVWKDVSPQTKITLPEWSHVKVKLFNNDPETEHHKSEELVLRRSKQKTRDPRIKSLTQDKIHSLLNKDRNDARRREDFDVSMPVEEPDSYTTLQVEQRTVSPVQDRDPRRKTGNKRDPRQRDPRKSSSQEKDSLRSSTEDRKSPTEERDPRKRVQVAGFSPAVEIPSGFSPAVQLPVITPEKVELPENRLQPLSSFPQKPNKPISKVMPMVKQTDHKDPRRRKRVPDITPHLPPDHHHPHPQSEPHHGALTSQQGESIGSDQSIKTTDVETGDVESDSDDGELKIDIKEIEEDNQDHGDCSKKVAADKTELFKKILPQKFVDVKNDETELKEGDIGVDISEKHLEEEKSELAMKNPVLDESKKMSGLDDSFGLWDEVYGVTEVVNVERKKAEENIKTGVEESIVNDGPGNADSIPPSTKLGVNLKEFAKNMVRNTLMRPSKNSPRSNELTKSSQEPIEESDANKEVAIDNLIEMCVDNKKNPQNNIDQDVETEKKVDADPPLIIENKERDDEEMKQLEISRDDCRKKIEDLERERRDLQQRELLLSLEKERDRLNKSLEMEDAAQALADELEDGEITDSDEEEEKCEGEGNTSIESPKPLEIDENSRSPSPPENSSIFVTIRHDTEEAVVRRKSMKAEKKRRKKQDPTTVPKNPLLRGDRRSSDEIEIISDTTQEGNKKKKISQLEEVGEKSKNYASEKRKFEESNTQSGGDGDLGKRKKDKVHADIRGGSVSEDDGDSKERRKSGSKERYPKYWEEFEQQIETKKKPKQKSLSEDEDDVKGAFDEDTVWINNQERSQHWTRKSVQSIISGSNKKIRTGHKPNLDLEVLEIPSDTGAEDVSPNQNFWGSQKRFHPPPSVDTLQFPPPSIDALQFGIPPPSNFQQKMGSSNLQEKRLLASQEEFNKRFKRNDWTHFSTAGRANFGNPKENPFDQRPNTGFTGQRESTGFGGIKEIGTCVVSGVSERWGSSAVGIPSLMDVQVNPPPQNIPADGGKSPAFKEVSTSQKNKLDKETGRKSGMEFVESIQKQVLVLAESHKKKMESIENTNEAKEDKTKIKNDEKEDQSKRTRKDSKEDSNLFLYFYEGDAMLHDEDENSGEALEDNKVGEALEETKEDEKSEKCPLPLPVPCLGDTTHTSNQPTQQDDASKKPVPVSPVVNRRVVMEEAFGLGKCLANIKNDPTMLKSDKFSTVSPNLPSPVPASKKKSLHVDVDHEEETPKPAPMITPPPPTISQAKWRQNSETSQPPTKAEVYRHTIGLDNKNPITALHELCQKRKWDIPVYKEMEHDKKWIISALVNGKEFTKTKPFNKKKEAKMEAAKICLEEMDIL